MGSSARMEQWGCEAPDMGCWWLSWLTPSQSVLRCQNAAFEKQDQFPDFHSPGMGLNLTCLV